MAVGLAFWGGSSRGGGEGKRGPPFARKPVVNLYTTSFGRTLNMFVGGENLKIKFPQKSILLLQDGIQVTILTNKFTTENMFSYQTCHQMWLHTPLVKAFPSAANEASLASKHAWSFQVYNQKKIHLNWQRFSFKKNRSRSSSSTEHPLLPNLGTTSQPNNVHM